MTQTTGRLAFRATSADLANVDIVAAALRAEGKQFVTRSDAVRAGLEAAAEAARSKRNLT